jgi:hypothetical protein
MPRYAIYCAPQEDSPWWSIWSQWLGRDAIARQDLIPPKLDGIDPLVFKALTKDPCRYGLHATIKAPFHLNEQVSFEDMRAKIKELAQVHSPFLLELGFQQLNHFYALTPVGDHQTINQLAFEVVRELDVFRRPLSEKDLAKRRSSGLTAKEDEMLLKWGYPFVAECFRFHLSLTGHLNGVSEQIQHHLRAEILARLEVLKHAPFVVDSLCLFEEPEAGADFFMLERFSFKKV